MTQLFQLDGYRLLTASGPERASFLQGQLTQDVTRLAPGEALLAGWADARGRLQWAGQAFLYRDLIGLLVPAKMAAALLARLRLYVLRARTVVTIADLAVAGTTSAAQEIALPSEWERIRLAGDASRSLLVGPPAGLAAITHAPGVVVAPQRAWEMRDIRAGIPEIDTSTSGEFVPQMVNLDLLDGISFSKGCYTGQEIVARTKYLGRVKRRMLRFACTAEAVAGQAIHGERGPVGQVVRAVFDGTRSELLAVIQLDFFSGTLFADEARMQSLTRLSLPYELPV